MQIRFDTLNKKPKLYDVLLVGALVLAAIIALSVIGKGKSVLPAALLLTLLAAYSAFNRRHGWDFSPFYPVMEYTRASNAAPGAVCGGLQVWLI